MPTKIPLRLIVLSLVALLELTLGQPVQVPASTNKPIRILAETKIDLDWNHLATGGVQIRVYNNTRDYIQVAARLRPADGFKQQDMDSLELICPFTTSDGTCLHRLPQIAPEQSNFFRLQTLSSKRPSKVIKLTLEVNESRSEAQKMEVFVHPRIKGVPPAPASQNPNFLFLPPPPPPNPNPSPPTAKPMVIDKDSLSEEVPLYSAPLQALQAWLWGLMGQTVGLSQKNKTWSAKIITPAICTTEESICKPSKIEVPLADANPGGLDLEIKEVAGNLTFTLPSQPLQPGIYGRSLNSIFGRDGKPLNLRFRVRTSWHVPVLVLLLGLGVGYGVRRYIGVTTPTENLLLRLHNASKRLLMSAQFHRNHPALSKHLEGAFFTIAKATEQGIRNLRVLTPLTIPASDPRYTGLVTSTELLEKTAKSWTELLSLIDKMCKLKTKVKNAINDPQYADLKATLRALEAHLEGRTLAAKAHTQATNIPQKWHIDHMEEAKKLLEAFKDYIRDAEAFVKDQTTALSSLPDPAAGNPTTTNTLLDRASQTLKQIWLQIGGYFPRRIKVYGNFGVSQPTIRDSLLVALPMIPLLLAALNESYFSKPAFGSPMDYLLAFTWGFSTQAAVQSLFAFIERIPARAP